MTVQQLLTRVIENFITSLFTWTLSVVVRCSWHTRFRSWLYSCLQVLCYATCVITDFSGINMWHLRFSQQCLWDMSSGIWHCVIGSVVHDVLKECSVFRASGTICAMMRCCIRVDLNSQFTLAVSVLFPNLTTIKSQTFYIMDLHSVMLAEYFVALVCLVCVHSSSHLQKCHIY
jgi:hypothetical protein